MINVVLHEPEIPQNTGNIARTCKSTGSALHLIRPLGFEPTDAKLKRAGLDYWHELELHYYSCFDEFVKSFSFPRIWLFTTKAERQYHTADFKDGDFLVFGKETAGLPEEIRLRFPESCLRVPMVRDNRSLNLSNTVALTLYEAYRQISFPGMD